MTQYNLSNSVDAANFADEQRDAISTEIKASDGSLLTGQDINILWDLWNVDILNKVGEEDAEEAAIIFRAVADEFTER